MSRDGPASGQNTLHTYTGIYNIYIYIYRKRERERVVNFGGPEGPVGQIHFPHLHARAPGIFSDLFRSVEMLNTEWDAESNGKLPHLFIPSKTVTFVPEFAVKDLPLGRTH